MEQMSVNVSDVELLQKLKDTENSFIERKTFSDRDDWLRAVVGFANTCPLGFPGILYIGVRDDGTVQNMTPPTNIETLQKTVSEIINRAYPPIYAYLKPLRIGSDELLAVIVPGSPSRPHFAAHAYIRVGCETKKASESQFESLIAQRNSKAYEILKWKNKYVTVARMNPLHVVHTMGSIAAEFEAALDDCNQFYVVVHHSSIWESVPLERVSLSEDRKNNRLRIEIRPA